MSKNKQQKQDITLLTLLANEATSDARKLLLKHGKKDAVNAQDLEVKLAELYFSSPDKKIELEKEMAQIHPHRKWLMKYIELPKPEIKVEEVKKVEQVAVPCPACEIRKFSSAEGSPVQVQPTVQKDNVALFVLGMVSVVAIYAISQKK